ncbi:carbamoyltransferase C-terminal domain-containing protein [Pseudomonas sp. NyZ704]|nr:carbamoyltransferase C-terminal domain-containing protein [Pseudomonas sp. NyZ704]
MALTILGLSGALGHDPAAAVYVGGKLIAAAEEERFVRAKHARNRLPYESAKFCLEQAGITPADVDIVTIAYAPISIFGKGRWHYAKRHWYAPDHSLDAIFLGNRRFKRFRRKILWCLEQLGFDAGTVRLEPLEHQLAHASSAYYCSGFKEKTAILCIGENGEYATTFFAYGERGKIHIIKEFYAPESLGALHCALSEYLGFDKLDGQLPVMSMAAYGDATRYDFSRLARFENGELIINTDYVNVVGSRRYKEEGKYCAFSSKLVEWLGPRPEETAAEAPYVHYAASMQALVEELTLEMMDYYLGDILRETGKIAFAGSCSLNLKLNQRIIARPEVKELFVQPAFGEAGVSVGAAAYISEQQGVPVEEMENVYLGPKYSNEDVIAACVSHLDRPQWQLIEDAPEYIADILAEGHPVAWFQGRMEFGPRAMGNRSILGCPSVVGIVGRIKSQLKVCVPWRPFNSSMLDTAATQMLETDPPSTFMNFAFDVKDKYKRRLAEIVHEDNAARIQVLKREHNPRYYDLMIHMERLTGNGVLLSTSLNPDGEPMACSPKEALDMFFSSDLQYLVMEDVLVVKA